MNILCTSHKIISKQNPQQGIRHIQSAGFEDIFWDLSAYVPSWKLESVLSENMEDISGFLEDVLIQEDKGGLKSSIVQMPYLAADTKQKNIQELLFKLALFAIEFGGRAGCVGVIIKPLFAGVLKEMIWEVNRAYYLSLAEMAKKQESIILLENQCKSIHGHLVRGICAEAEEAVKWVDALNEEVGEERFGFCLDVGVCNICGQNMYDFVCSLGHRIKTVKMRDCDGMQDSSLLPFTCANKGLQQTDWRSLIWGLREIEFKGSLILDFADTIAGFSPLFRPQILQIAKSLGDYFGWQIEMEQFLQKYDQRVLFGAGNMCRNYMKYYGEKFPPLFTCDNNSKLWETSFCGLKVNSPEYLKGLPENCAIVICNIYYKEITCQIKNMKLTNPIVYFSDEYLPVQADMECD